VTVARFIRWAIPDRWQVPARYYHQRARRLLEPELDLLIRSIRPGDCVIDVGASFGVFSYAFLQRGAIVHAFEPQPVCLATLNAYARAHPRLHVHPIALSDASGDGVLTLPVTAPAPGSPGATLRSDVPAAATIDVHLGALDDFDIADVSLIKVDVEGGELGVLRGAIETIRRSRPLLMIEIEQRHHHEPVASVIAEVLALGYRGAVLEGERLVDVRADSNQLDELYHRGKYNFLFTHHAGNRAWTP
jgi:FkbM family methyltransferase